MKYKLIAAAILEILSQSAISGVEEAIKDILKDPESARFYEVRRFPNGNACGFVNAKNSFGGYVGKQPFEYVYGYVNLKPESYQLACDRAVDPMGFDTRKKEAERAAAGRLKTEEQSRQAKIKIEVEAAREAERKRRTREEAENAKLTQRAYLFCSANREQIINEIK
ncbi:hypothetical protein, partial [Azohydromonas lata]